PNLDFGGLFITMAIKEGSSEEDHIDWNDPLFKYAIVFTVGEYTGADFVLPQLGRRIPFPPGSIFLVRTRLLVHCATLVASG
ncbi:hypothetical protein K438DRAFT_1446246, partial [Mycena galopus ATCC 62051]